MNEQQYNELLKAYTKEALANMIKASIRQQFSELLASQYCQKFDDFKMVVDLLEYKAKQNDITVLFDNGMYDIFIDKYLSKKFVCSNPGDKCYKTNFYISLINRGGINDKLIGNLSKAVKGFFPYTLKERLKSEIFSEEANKIKYLETIDRLDLEDFMNLKATEKIEK